MYVVYPYQTVTCGLVLQDYQLFFEAVECETLFKFLHIDAPQDEVEYIINNAPKEEVNRRLFFLYLP